jgi:hypothetical protein
MSAQLAFPHRQNLDGTIDSICPDCFTTVATSSDETVLLGAERLHKCIRRITLEEEDLEAEAS